MLPAPAVAKSPWSTKYGPFEVLHAGDELRNQEVEIGIALAVRVRRHVDWRTCDGHREVAAVIEIEPAQEVLIGFSLTAVLRDDHARHSLEHLGLPHERTDVELLCGDRALARRRGDADEILGGIFHVREVGERALAHDDDFGVERQMHDLVVGDDLSSAHLEVFVVHGGEVDETHRELIRARWNILEVVVALPVSHDLAWLAATQQLHGDARKRSTCFISDAPFDVSASSALREGRNTEDRATTEGSRAATSYSDRPATNGRRI